jgi:hypothetical protein
VLAAPKQRLGVNQRRQAGYRRLRLNGHVGIYVAADEL